MVDTTDSNKYDIRVLLKKTLIKNVMTKPVVKVCETDDLSVVGELFLKRGIRHMAVVDTNKKLVGLISKRDLYRTVSPRKDIHRDTDYAHGRIEGKRGDYYLKETLDSFILKNVMVKNPITLHRENSIADAIKVMIEKKIGCVLVVDEHREVEGIITRYDILKMAHNILVNS